MFGNWKNFIVIVVAIVFASCSLIDIEGLRPDVVPNAPSTPIIEAANRLLSARWETVKGARTYEVWAGTTNNSSAATKRDGDVSGLSANITGLTNDTTYYVWIKAKNKAGTSDFSPVASGTPSAFAVTPLTPQTAPAVVAGNKQLTISWEAIEGATAYEVWMGTANNPNMATKRERAGDISGLSTVITGLNNNTTYYVWIKAKNDVGTSGFSPVASGTPSVPTTPPPTAQTAPTVVLGSGQLSLSWEAIERATAYEVWRGTINNPNTATKQGGDVSGLSAVITGLNNGTVYYVWIKAKNSYGTSGFSPAASGKPIATPGMPTLSPDYGQLEVTWAAVAGADEYEVYYGIDTPTTLATTTSGTTATITGLTEDITYSVRLRAKNANGVSDFGPSASGVSSNERTPGLYRGIEKIGNQNLSASLSYISTNAVSGDDFYIVVGADESVSPTNLSYSGKTVGITLMGLGGERTVTLGANGSMFTVSSGVTLILDDNITLVGRSSNNVSLVRINSGGTLIMNMSSRITGNALSSSGSASHGGGVSVYGTFIMNGGTISGNSTYASNYYSDGGGVYVNGTFTMNGGTISGNSTGSGNSDGGGVYLSSGSSFTMNDGAISGNRVGSGRHGGGVGVNDNSTFNMTGGTISGNTAGSGLGGGVGVDFGGVFRMSGGVIYGSNAAADLRNGGGAFYLRTGGTAQYGVFSGGVFQSKGNLNSTDNTVRVVDGVLLGE